MRKLRLVKHYPDESVIISKYGRITNAKDVEEYLPGRFSFTDTDDNKIYTSSGQYLRSIVHRGTIVFRNPANF